MRRFHSFPFTIVPDPPYQSVFRERESDIRQPDLAAQFLKEIDRERNFEREEAYKENLRRLWEKYQQQENEIEEELFDDDKQRNYVPQSYWGPPPEKRRLVLPWLPAIRKRFPVAKRSSVYPKQEAQISGTNEKVARDLEAIFGQNDVIDEKKKRSSGDLVPETVSTTTTAKPHKIDKKSDRSRDDEHLARQDQSQHYDDYQKDKPEDAHSSDDNDEYHENDHDHDHEVRISNLCSRVDTKSNKFFFSSTNMNTIMKKMMKKTISRMTMKMIKRRNDQRLTSKRRNELIWKC